MIGKLILWIAALMLGSSTLLSQSIILTPDPTLVVNPANCTSITIGESLSFERSLACGPDALIATDGGSTEIFRTSDQTFDYTFNTIGEYIVFCNAAPGGVAVTATCVYVVPRVPTLGEWSLIVTGLLILIVSVVALKSYEASLSGSAQ